MSKKKNKDLQLPPIVPGAKEELEQAIVLLGNRVQGELSNKNKDKLIVLVGEYPSIEEALEWKIGLKRVLKRVPISVPLFLLPHKVDEYKLEAYIEGTFYPENLNQEKTPIVGRLVTLDKLYFPAFMSFSCWKKIQERKDFTPEQSYYWFLYFHTKMNKEILEVQLISPKIDKPYLVDFGGTIFDPKIDYMRIRGRIIKIFKKSFSIKVECQSHYEKDLLYKPFTLKIDGALPASAAPEELWEVVGRRKGNVWTLLSANIADAAKLRELKINRRDILRELLFKKTDMNAVPRHLKEKKKEQSTSEKTFRLYKKRRSPKSSD